MAETIGLLILAAIPGPFAIGGVSGLAVGGLSISASTIGAGAILAASVGLSYATTQTPKQPKPANGLLSIRQTNPVRQGAFGSRVRVAATGYMLYETDASTGTRSVDVLSLIGGQICGVKQFYMNEDAPSRSGGSINSMADGRYFGSSVAVNWRLGLPTETAYSEVVSDVPALWTTDHRGDGVASMSLRCQQAPTIDAQPTYFPNGKPEPSVEIDGYPLWDPRDVSQDPDDRDSWLAYPAYAAGTTYAAGDRVIFPSDLLIDAYSAGTTYARYATVSQGGVNYYSRVSGNIGHTPGTDLTKWIPLGAPYYSRVAGNVGNTPDLSPDKWCSVLSNPVLQLIDYLADNDHGMGLDRDILITPVIDALMVEANLCDALVIDKNGDYGPRYTSCGKFNFDDDPADVLGQIGASCDAWWCEDGDGTIALKVGVYREPDITLSFDRGHLLLGPFSINYGIADEQIVNDLALTFTDPANNYKEVPGQDWRNEDDISTRGVTRSQPFSVTWVQRHSQARRLSKRAMARLSAPTGTFTTTLYGLRAIGQRWVRIQFPFVPELSNAVVEISKASIEFTKGLITFNWMLVDPDTIDAWDAETEEGDGPTAMRQIVDDLGNPILDDAGNPLINEQIMVG